MGNERRSNRSPDLSRYEGFKGAWDKELQAFVFVSQEERDRFQIATYGAVRMGFREPDEPDDGRLRIERDRCRCRGCRDHEGFWKDRTERMTYEAAVEDNPRRPDEGPASYIRRISEIVSGKYSRVKSVPHTRMSRTERDGRLALLRNQEIEIL